MNVYKIKDKYLLSGKVKNKEVNLFVEDFQLKSTLITFGIQENEIDYGLDALIRNYDDVISFGIFGTFITTYKLRN